MFYEEIGSLEAARCTICENTVNNTIHSYISTCKVANTFTHGLLFLLLNSMLVSIHNSVSTLCITLSVTG